MAFLLPDTLPDTLMPIELAVIPVAGRGTRLMPLTKSLPKEMLPLGRKPVIEHVVDELTRARIQRIHMVTSADKSVIDNHFDHNESLIESLREQGKEELLSAVLEITQAASFSYSRQSAPLGLGHAVLTAKAFVGDRPFLVALGDALIGSRQGGIGAPTTLVDRMVDAFDHHQADAVIAFHTVPKEDVVLYGIAQPGELVDSQTEIFTVDRLVEKPSVDTAPSCYAIAARYVFRSSIFGFLEQTTLGRGNEIQLTDAVQSLLDSGGRVLGVPLLSSEKRYDIGNLKSYYQAVVDAALTDPEHGDAVKATIASLLNATS